jgi:hypothetical protein
MRKMLQHGIEFSVPRDYRQDKSALLTLDIKHPSEFWERDLCVLVMDRDGWRDLNWETPITFKEFLDRASNSTTEYTRGFMAVYADPRNNR